MSPRHQKPTAIGAWVPFVAERGDEERVADMVGWLMNRVGSKPVVVISQDKHVERSVSWDGLRGQGVMVTMRSRSRVSLPSGYAAVLAFLPRVQELAFAAEKAKNNKFMCVVEAPSLPVTAWARDVRALNIETDEAASPYPSEVAKSLEDLWGSGRNGWGPDFDRIQAGLALNKLRGHQFGNTVDIRVAAAGREFSPDQIETLVKLAKKTGFEDPPQRDWLDF